MTTFPPVLDREGQTGQSLRAFDLSHRLTVAKIRLKRAGGLSNEVANEIKSLDRNLHSVSDSLILGEDVGPHLDSSERSIAEFEQRVLV
jgi:hypothetical protein